MKRDIFLALFWLMVLGTAVIAANTATVVASSAADRLLFDFSGNTVQENQVTLMGAGFGQYPFANAAFGAIPTDHAFKGATDGKGLIVQADPGEGIMIFTPPIKTTNCALLRCSVRASASHASIYLASVDLGENVFVSTLTVNNGNYFVDQYRRLADFFLPPSTGFQGIVQIINTSKTEPLTVYVDNLEALFMSADKIEAAVSEITGETEAPEATSTPVPPVATPTPTPSPGGETFTVSLTNLPAGAKPLEMVLIPAGTFIMGSSSTERGRYKGRDWYPHQVTLTKSFYLGKCEVTQAQYQAVTGSNPARSYGVGANYPVYYVSWYDAAKFCNALSRNEGLTLVYTESGDWAANISANGYRLPSEAEWEYACRAGTTTRFSFGDALECDDSCGFCELADKQMWWCGNNTYGGNVSGTKEVGKKLPNPWGLYDMHGNVWEWCSDSWQSPTNRGAQVDPAGPNSGSYWVLRGGYWSYDLGICRSADRDSRDSDYTYYYVGFRVSRTP
ncbi:MAG: formylglycine-generating enzyme family protein [Candidatus Omnitrophota bacterium]